jgi:single-stranded-DNA-specific exonuclease
VELSRFDALAEALRARWREHRRRGWRPPPLEYEGELPLAALSLRLMDGLARLAPFGEDNPAPVLGARQVTVLDARRMGADGRHLSMQLGQGAEQRRAVSFGDGDLAPTLRPGQLVDVLFVPKVNRFRGRANVELELVDLRVARGADAGSSRAAEAGA